MSAIASQESGDTVLTDLTLDELIDGRRSIVDYIARKRAEIAEAENAQRDYDSMIQLRMEETRARKFERAGFVGSYVKKKIGTASLLSPKIAYERLCAVAEAGDIPAHAVDDAFEIVTPDPFVKGDLRKFRKIAEYGGAAADIVRLFVQEAREVEVFVIEELRPQIDVTDTARATLEAKQIAGAAS